MKLNIREHFLRNAIYEAHKGEWPVPAPRPWGTASGGSSIVTPPQPRSRKGSVAICLSCAAQQENPERTPVGTLPGTTRLQKKVFSEKESKASPRHFSHTPKPLLAPDPLKVKNLFAGSLWIVGSGKPGAKEPQRMTMASRSAALWPHALPHNRDKGAGP